jgi:bifunctional UDP-N-acetylglucosamine pyrophosphorylase/glucosamine-1-phosphate N-acetyltransferase
MVSKDSGLSSATRSCAAIILAAGEGTRMKSDIPKVLHEIANLSMIGHVIMMVQEAGVDTLIAVIGPGREDVRAEILKLCPSAKIVVQEHRLGTAHAVLAAKSEIGERFDDLLVLFADTPLLRAETLQSLRKPLSSGAAVVALGFNAENPAEYGRFLTEGDRMIAIREHKDATEAEREVTLCNSGLMALDGKTAIGMIEAIENKNSQREFYLTDVVEIANRRGLASFYRVADEQEVMGVNDRVQLSKAEAVFQGRLRNGAMLAGVTMTAPETVFLSFDTRFGRDVHVEPHVFFGRGVSIGDNVRVKAFSHLEETKIAEQAEIGPFARLRPGTELGVGVKIGNFVEVKKSVIGDGAKINHLSYIGDATIGARSNIGAGTITCNYDGFFKYTTIIGEDAFIGANSSLLAPISIGNGAFVGSGSVVTDDVPANALALARGQQVVKLEWATAFREKARAKKARK